MQNLKLWRGLAVVFLIVAAFMTAYSLGWLGPENVVYADNKGLAGAPPAGGFSLNPKTTKIVGPASEICGSFTLPPGATVLSVSKSSASVSLPGEASEDVIVDLTCPCTGAGTCYMWNSGQAIGCSQGECGGSCSLSINAK
jgi:hypothetical protein